MVVEIAVLAVPAAMPTWAVRVGSVSVFAMLYANVQIEWLGTWPVIGPVSTLDTRPLPS